MSILFGRGSYADRMRFVLTATRQHATNLCKFASLYKAVTILLRRTRGGKPKGGDAFLAGVVGGYAVFGERNAVNEQVSARLAAGLRKAGQSGHWAAGGGA
jgi:peroxisomal membrane protein 4